MSFQLPEQGIVFWPVGCGDSTTICIDSSTRIQVDLNHLEKADGEDCTQWPILDELVKLLPKNSDKKPCLSLFALTHPDQDHCRGFSELLKIIAVNELWFTPRVFREYTKDLCDDAAAFKKEAQRRVKKVIKNKGAVSDGDRVRIIGYDDLLKEDEYKDFPRELLAIPGTTITSVNGVTQSKFKAFIHAPFKDDSYGDRNDASLGMQITLTQSPYSLRAWLLGDLAYPTVKRIMEKSKTADLSWDILLAPHHCSKSVMFWKDEGEKEEALKKEIMTSFETNKLKGGYVIASAEYKFTDEENADPPHLKARKQYEKIVDAGHFICTHEYPTKANPEPLVYRIDSVGNVTFEDKRNKGIGPAGLGSAVIAARGPGQPPAGQKGFGSK